ncbi:hypothetical protein ACFCV9_05560 [Streptomyces sp. NPDC056367]|uniref:hypothetical protein n=1 Tax=Streptomyces sp. NPDC056367 TaxID=3345797 RepID=UPI0035DC9797
MINRAATGLAVLVATAALLLTGCGKNEAAAPDSATQTQTQTQDMQQKLDNADQAAAQADSDAAQNN